jgi:DNA-binding transcriptional MerR regulator
MNADAQGWKLGDLATAAGVSARTIRYYVQRGLLPSPEFRGKDTSYGEEHLTRLRAIAALQGRHLPLDEIQRVLDALDPDGIAAIAAGQAPPFNEPEAPVPTPAPSPDPASRWTVWQLAPGVELHVSDAASPEHRERAQQAWEQLTTASRGMK